MTPLEVQAMQVIHMMKAMPGQQIIVNTPTEEQSEELYQVVLKQIEAMHVDAQG